MDPHTHPSRASILGHHVDHPGRAWDQRVGDTGNSRARVLAPRLFGEMSIKIDSKHRARVSDVRACGFRAGCGSRADGSGLFETKLGNREEMLV